MFMVTVGIVGGVVVVELVIVVGWVVVVVPVEEVVVDVVVVCVVEEVVVGCRGLDLHEIIAPEIIIAVSKKNMHDTRLPLLIFARMALQFILGPLS